MNSALSVRYFQVGACRLAYRILGSGPLALLAFHGFGQDSRVFTDWQPPLEQRYTIYAIDLFFHGNSDFPTDQVLTQTTWQELIGAFLHEHQIDRFTLAGFSLGGRFALVTASQFTDRLDQLMLIAPDGITQTIWYRLATGSSAGRWLFRLVLRHLSALSTIGHGLIRLSLLHPTVMRFAEVSLASPDQRHLVDLSWTAFRRIRVDTLTVAAELNQYMVRVRFFTGYFDQIVPGYFISPLAKRLHRYEHTVLKAGHNRLIDQIGQLV